MKVTHFGTTMLLFDDGTDQLLLDAHVSRPSMKQVAFGSLQTDHQLVNRMAKRFDMTRLRAVLASHSHHDHVLDLAAFANVTNAAVYGSPSTLNVARGEGVPEDVLHDFTAETQFSVGSFQILVMPSRHSKPTIFSNDLGLTIDCPLMQPANHRQYKEGGSFDFLISHPQATMLVRPSFNYLPGQLDNVQADVLFQGITHIHKADKAMRKAFFVETLDKAGASTCIPLHWDNFFTPLEGPIRNWPFFMGDFHKDLNLMNQECSSRNITFRPLTLLSVEEL